MHIFSTQLTLFIIQLFLVPLLAFSQQYNFRNYSIAEGLAQSQVYAICEDGNGNIWSGTRGGGVSRFDGISFTNYTEEDGLVNNYIRTIMLDKSGNLWIGTDNGLSRYDGKSFHNYGAKDGLYNETVIDLLQDRKGTLWIATEGGIFHFDGNSIFRFGRKLKLPQEKVNCLYEDHKGNIWAGTESGAYKFDLETNEYRSRLYTRKDGLPVNIISSIKEDAYDNLWFSTYGGGVSRLDKNNTFTNYSIRDGLASNTVLCSSAKANGVMWFGTSNGASKCIIKDSTVTFVTYTQTEGLPNNVVMTIMNDSFGNVWFGTSGGGIGKLGSERFVHFTGIKGVFGNWVYSIIEDQKGQMWFGTSEGGVTRYDGKFYKRFSEKDGFTAAKVKYIHQDLKGNLWFGTIGDGAYLNDGITFRHFGTKNGMSSNFINYIISDSLGKVWFATAGGGISILELSGTRYKVKKIGKKDGLMDDRVNALLLDRSGNIWAGTNQGAYKIIRGEDKAARVIMNFTNTSGLTNLSIRAIIEDKGGNIFLGTAGAGIIRYNGSSYFIFQRVHGLASANIYSLVVDDSGFVWAGSEKGIDRLVVDQVTHYGKSEGFAGIETIQNSVCKDKKGNLWFGTVDRATLYIPSNDQENKIAPKTHITGLRLFFNKIEKTPYADSIKPWYALPVHLNLPYNQNHLSFEFAGIELTNPEAVRYSYVLEGFESKWSPFTEKREAVYSNLPPGEYTFKVISKNEYGWGSKEEVFNFSIAPPFWGRWWFRISSLLMLGLLFGFILSFRVKALKRKNKEEKLRLEMERDLVELEQKSLRLQMNPHFLFNCLNSIKGLIAENRQEEAKLYLSKFSKMMRSMLDNSSESFIPLHDEISGLKNYGELEKLSREDKFEFYIEADPAIDPEASEIPPMLIQPFVENAILHGIAPKEGKGWVKVKFSISGDYMKCIIEDNGIGREKAYKMKNDSSQKHKSAAIAVTQERLNILNKKLNFPEVKIMISDLQDDNGFVSGTKVELFIPYIKI
jgi:ligand-binding sensor domain-containing protein